MEEDNDFDDLFCKLLTDYYCLYPLLPQINAAIILTNHMNETHFELRPEMRDELISQGIEKDNEQNGRMVLPSNVGETIYILMNAKNILEYTKDGSMTWVGTFAHELTHAIDFHSIALKENMNIYDPLLRAEFSMFQLWSEYHARRLGYNFLRTKMITNNISQEEQINHIIETEMPRQIKLFFDAYHQTTNGNKQMYETMQFLGRFSIWCDIFPNEFNYNTLKDYFWQNKWMLRLFYFLRECGSLDLIYPRFDEMKKILESNWTFQE